MASSDRNGSTLNKLLKVARVKVDEINASLAAVKVARDSTETAIARLDYSVIEEQRRAEKMQERYQQGESPIDMTGAAEDYAKKIAIKRANMQATLSQLEERERVFNEDLVERYNEIKKLEHLIDSADRKVKTQRGRRAEARQNEMIAARYGRS